MIERDRIEAWRAERLARATAEPPEDWLPVVLAGTVVGVVHPDVASLLALDGDRLDRPGFGLGGHFLGALAGGQGRARRESHGER